MVVYFSNNVRLSFSVKIHFFFCVRVRTSAVYICTRKKAFIMVFSSKFCELTGRKPWKKKIIAIHSSSIKAKFILAKYNKISNLKRISVFIQNKIWASKFLRSKTDERQTMDREREREIQPKQIHTRQKNIESIYLELVHTHHKTVFMYRASFQITVCNKYVQIERDVKYWSISFIHSLWIAPLKQTKKNPIQKKRWASEREKCHNAWNVSYISVMMNILNGP